MKQYKLIKTYPNSPELGTIVTYYANWHMYGITNECIFKAKIIENSPEFWQKVIQKDYEILSFTDKPNTGRIYRKYTSNLFYSDDSAKLWSESDLLKDEDVKIHSVKRLFDGEIFTIGDKLNDKSFTENARHPLSKTDIWDNIITKIAIVKNSDSEVAGYSYTNMNGQLMFSASNKWKNLNVSLKDAIKAKKPLFITEDGKEIFEYQEYWFITTLDWKLKSHTMGISDRHYPPLGNKQFSTKEAAWEYILMNKPVLSLNDVRNAMKTPLSWSCKLEELVKSKINTN